MQQEKFYLTRDELLSTLLEITGVEEKYRHMYDQQILMVLMNAALILFKNGECDTPRARIVRDALNCTCGFPR